VPDVQESGAEVGATSAGLNPQVDRLLQLCMYLDWIDPVGMALVALSGHKILAVMMSTGWSGAAIEQVLAKNAISIGPFKFILHQDSQVAAFLTVKKQDVQRAVRVLTGRGLQVKVKGVAG